MIDIQNACKFSGDTILLNQITLSVPPKGIVGLAGPSGSGKSTLLQCIQGLQSLDSGAIAREGTSGFMFQDFQLFPHMSVLENLIYAPRLHDPKQDHSCEALSLLTNLGIESKAQKCPRDLSGGQKQRVALARSLMMNPQILLCDEPTSGLDVATTMDIVALLRSVQERGVTMVIASQDLDFLTHIADRIVLLKKGTLVENMDPKAFEVPIGHLKQLY